MCMRVKAIWLNYQILVAVCTLNETSPIMSTQEMQSKASNLTADEACGLVTCS